MNLIDQQDVNATSYKKAAVITFNNTGTIPEILVYEDTVIPNIMSQRTGQYTVAYRPDINIPLSLEALDLLESVQIDKTLSIAALLYIMLDVYKMARSYTPPVSADIS